MLLSLVLAAGCSMKVMKPTSDDPVRARAAELERSNRVLVEENEGLKARISELTADHPEDVAQAEEARHRLVSLAIASSSVVEPRASESDPGILVLRLDPRDDRGRFMQVVGSLEVRAVSVPAIGDPVLLASTSFDPLEVREAWRGGILGSGYVFEIELDGTPDRLPDTIDVVTIFRDAGSARTLRDESPVVVSRGIDA